MTTSCVNEPELDSFVRQLLAAAARSAGTEPFSRAASRLFILFRRVRCASVLESDDEPELPCETTWSTRPLISVSRGLTRPLDEEDSAGGGAPALSADGMSTDCGGPVGTLGGDVPSGSPPGCSASL